MMGGNLPSTDVWTSSLLTNWDVIAVDQHSSNGHSVLANGDAVVWLAQGDKGERYLAIFNIGDTRQRIQHAWKDLGLAKPEYHLLNLWTHEDLDRAGSLKVTLEPHACILYRLTETHLTIQ